MFKKTLILIFLLSLSNLAQAATATFSWLPNDDDAEGYKVLWGYSTRDYVNTSEAGFPTPIDGRIYHTILDIPEGVVLYFAAIADKGSEGEEGYIKSDYSVEVVHTFLPSPQNFRLE